MACGKPGKLFIALTLISVLSLLALAQNPHEGQGSGWEAQEGEDQAKGKDDAVGQSYWNLCAELGETSWYVKYNPYVQVVCAVYNLIMGIFKLVVSAIMKLVEWVTAEIIALVFELIKAGWSYEIDVDDYAELHEQILLVLIPLYYIQIVVVGMYYIFASMAPGSRAKAKDMLQKLVLSMVLVSVSSGIYTWLVDFSIYLSTEVWDAVENAGILSQDPFVLFGKALGTGFTLAGIALGIATGNPLIAIAALGAVYSLLIVLILPVLMVLAIRIVMLILFYILFPLTIFLYFIPPTKKLGSKLFGMTVTWIFLPVIMAIAFAATAACLDQVIGTAEIQNWSDMVPTFDAAKLNAGIPVVEWKIQTTNPFYTLLMPVTAAFIVVAGFLIAAFTPLMFTGTLAYAGAALAGAGMTAIGASSSMKSEHQKRLYRYKGAAAVFAGGLAMGAGSRSMVHAATQAAWMKPQGLEGGILGGSQVADDVRLAHMDRLQQKKSQAGKPWRKRFGNTLSNIGRGSVLGAFGRMFTIDSAQQEEALEHAPSVRQAVYGSQGYSGAGSQSKSTKGAGAYVDEDTSGKEGMPLSPRANKPFGSREGGSYNMYSKLDSEGQLTSVEGGGQEGAYGGLAYMFLWDRVGQLYKAGQINSQIRRMKKQKGASIGEIQRLRSRRNGLVINAVRLGLFYPLRHVGRVLYNVTPEVLPPALQPIGYTVGKGMAGLGLRQMALRTQDRAGHFKDKTKYHKAGEDLEYAEKKRDQA
ncbi:MAG: hypothetical protein GF334_12740, partial [Candidatus Altiarchaeales archaeon]|nr:hypothetical protein [Candidatus Altiarchaeales archaeon]